MFINIKETRINTDHIISYGVQSNGNIYIEFSNTASMALYSKEVDIQKTLLQLDRIINPKHIDIFEVKK